MGQGLMVCADVRAGELREVSASAAPGMTSQTYVKLDFQYFSPLYIFMLLYCEFRLSSGQMRVDSLRLGAPSCGDCAKARRDVALYSEIGYD